MASDGDEPQLMPADCFCNGGGPYLRNRAINDRGILIHHFQFAINDRLGQCASESHAKLLTIGEASERSNPRRRAGKADAAEEIDNLANRQLGGESIQDAAIRWPIERN